MSVNEKVLNDTVVKPLYFIITAGVTGSGKTKLISETTKLLNIDAKDCVKILVDDLVEKSPKYKKHVNNIISLLQPNNEKGLYLRKKLENPVQPLFKMFSNAYFDQRRKPPCNGHEMSCDELNNKLLKTAIEEKRHIIFEFTGQSMPTWLLKEDWFRTPEYQIIFSYSLVNINKLTMRNKTRAYNSYLKYIKNRRNPTFRLPNVSENTFRPLIEKLNSVLLNVYTCVENPNTDECPKKHINRLLVFDNNTVMTLKFDSDAIKGSANALSSLEKVISNSANVTRVNKFRSQSKYRTPRWRGGRKTR